MSTSIKQHIALYFFVICSIASWSQSNTRLGYRINGEWLTFVFNVEDYSNITDFNIPVQSVFVAGEFNDWSPDAWKMQPMDNGTYELTKPLSDFTGDFDWEFKFVVNGEHWAEPTEEFENKITARTKYGDEMHVYNLRLYSAFATKYGNVTFHLKGYKNARKVIVSGTFNRWDETNFIMNADEDGWTVTLQLRPDTYEYKFIVDGKWIIDPQNPDVTENKYGGLNSVITITKIVEFKLWGYQSASTIILSGDFNDWSEDQLKMQKKDGYWLAQVELTGGKHHYKFIVDGEWMTDPFNSVAEYDGEGNINSVKMVK